MSYRARAEHCRTAAISIYGLNDHLPRDEKGVEHDKRVVELHIRFGNQPITLRDLNSHLLVLSWRGNGFIEIFNAPAEKLALKDGQSTISIHELRLIDTPDEIRFTEAAPHTQRAYLGNEEPVEVHRRNAAGNGNGGGGNGGDGSNAGNGGPGSGGLAEVVAHPVLFSTEPDAYRRLLENY